MQTPDSGIIKWLAQTLRYKLMPEYIGRELVIHELASIDDDIRRVLEAEIPEPAEWFALPASEVEEALLKHGIIDVSYIVPAGMLDSDYETGIELLQSLGFIMDSAEERAFEVVSQLVGDKLDDATDLLVLKEDLEEGSTYLRLFLHAEPASQEQSPDLLPCLFVIDDACIANAQSVWLHRHFYW
jgi:hypothetical protein